MRPPRDYRMRFVAGSPVDPDERLDEFFRYWRRVRGDRPMPSRADVDPTEIPPRLLPNLFLTDVVDGGARFRYRLVGTEAVRVIGSDPTGRYVDQINQTQPYRDYVTALYRRVVADRLPLFSISHYLKPDDRLGGYHATQRLMCPLSSDGRTVNMVCTCQIFVIAPREFEFPTLNADTSIVGVCEAVLE
jgi:hypothetical protein